MKEQPWYQGQVVTVGARTFLIEILERYKDNQLSEAKTWVVSRKNPRLRVPLPVPPPTENVPFTFNRIFVSPYEDTIITERKVCHGNNEMLLLHRTTALRYVRAEKQPLNERIGKQFGSPWKDASRYEQAVDMLRFQRWEAGGRRAVLGCIYIGKNWKSECYFVTLDVHTGRLSHYERTKEDNIREPS